METTTYHQIADLYNAPNLSYDLKIEFTIHSIPGIHPQIPFKSPVLRDDYFTFVLTKYGSGFYFLDDNKFSFGSRSLYFTNPGHTLSYELQESEEAFVITMSEKFLREYVHPDIYREFPFLLAEIVPPTNLSVTDFEEFEVLYRQIRYEFNKESRFKSKILGNFMGILLLSIKEKFWINYDPIADGNEHSQIVHSFKLLLESEFKKVLKNGQYESKLQLKDFADKLNLHPSYLDSVIISKTGRTVYDWITERMLSVAKRILVNTSISAKEIANRLGFSEPANISPHIFRNLKN